MNPENTDICQTWTEQVGWTNNREEELQSTKVIYLSQLRANDLTLQYESDMKKELQALEESLDEATTKWNDLRNRRWGIESADYDQQMEESAELTAKIIKEIERLCEHMDSQGIKISPEVSTPPSRIQGSRR